MRSDQELTEFQRSDMPIRDSWPSESCKALKPSAEVKGQLPLFKSGQVRLRKWSSHETHCPKPPPRELCFLACKLSVFATCKQLQILPLLASGQSMTSQSGGSFWGLHLLLLGSFGSLCRVTSQGIPKSAFRAGETEVRLLCLTIA